MRNVSYRMLYLYSSTNLLKSSKLSKDLYTDANLMYTTGSISFSISKMSSPICFDDISVHSDIHLFSKLFNMFSIFSLLNSLLAKDSIRDFFNFCLSYISFVLSFLTTISSVNHFLSKVVNLFPQNSHSLLLLIVCQSSIILLSTTLVSIF